MMRGGSIVLLCLLLLGAGGGGGCHHPAVSRNVHLSLDNLPRIIEALQESGFTFVPPEYFLKVRHPCCALP